jgi:predicted DNA-binding transcriptional regulator AlpA
LCYAQTVLAKVDSNVSTNLSTGGRASVTVCASQQCNLMQVGEVDVLLNADEVRSVLKVSRRTLESLLASDAGPPYLTIGRQRRWRPNDVNAWIEGRIQISAPSNEMMSQYKGDSAML